MAGAKRRSQATNMAMASTALSDSPLRILDERDRLHLVLSLVEEDDDDYFVLSLTCKPLRDALLLLRAVKKPTPVSAVISSPARAQWALSLGDHGPRWLRRWNTDTAAKVAEVGALTVLKWLYANLCSWDEDTCRAAAKNGHLEVLHWARANGCPWDAQVCHMAAKNGHLEVLQWASANGCPGVPHVCALAAHSGHLEVLQWARENGYPEMFNLKS